MSDRAEFARLLTRHFSAAGKVSDPQVNQLWRHYEVLVRWNRVVNLTGIRTMEGAVVRNYCPSLFVALHLHPGPVSVLDVGSGAGFPGVPMAIYRPDCQLTLAESNARKAAFLREATRGFPNVRVIAKRAETIEEAFDWVVSRAVGWRQLGKYVGRLGRFVALLLGTADAERVCASKGWDWQRPLALPWSHTGTLLIGTSCFT